MDPERQWISRLEPETPEDREPPDEAPLRRVPRLIAGGTTMVAAALEGLGLLGDGTGLRIAVVAVVAAVVAAAEVISRRRRASDAAFTAAVRSP